jgi:hypothetical protein
MRMGFLSTRHGSLLPLCDPHVPIFSRREGALRCSGAEIACRAPARSSLYVARVTTKTLFAVERQPQFENAVSETPAPLPLGPGPRSILELPGVSESGGSAVEWRYRVHIALPGREQGGAADSENIRRVEIVLWV